MACEYDASCAAFTTIARPIVGIAPLHSVVTPSSRAMRICRHDNHGMVSERSGFLVQLILGPCWTINQPSSTTRSKSHQCLEHVLVVPPLVSREISVGGHANEGDLRRCADEGAAAAGRHADAGLHKEVGRGSVLARQVFKEPRVDAYNEDVLELMEWWCTYAYNSI